ncbi:threonine/serine exporter family protein [Salsuginibacillus kocurii]|uniref:threonine/serine exporter family protein n=1 Tax=Salsuginibacillus kocurii TaxID=427078 RepID=UPI00035E75A2|nr:threonine/serine exporter family protein [Salsuginibacillus kocurii]
MWLEIILCFIATASFAVIFNVPARLVWIGGCIGIASWYSYSFLPILGVIPVFAAASAAFIAAFLSHLLARFLHVPVTTFAIPGVIPLVPGGRAYSTMLAFVEEDYLNGLERGIETILQAGAIAAGMVFALSIFSIRRGVAQRYETNRS